MAAPGFVDVDVPGIGTVELPDSMSPDQMAAAIHQLPAPKAQPGLVDQAVGIAKQTGVGAAKTLVRETRLSAEIASARYQPGSSRRVSIF